MKSTGGRITIEVSSIEIDAEDASQPNFAPGKYVKLRVADDGCGISEEQLPRIHDPYYTTKPIGVGTGLGLWTVYGLVNEHGGSIDVQSTSGTGTTFEIIFPVSTVLPESLQIRKPDKLTTNCLLYTSPSPRD